MKFELKPNKIIDISFKEFCARLWPFGKWTVIWHHHHDGDFDDKAAPVIKEKAVQAFLDYGTACVGSFSFQKTVRIKKVDGFFGGVEYEPRTTRRGKRKESNSL